MYADGTISVHRGHWEVPRRRSVSPQRPESQDEERGSWTTTYPTGEKIMYKGNGDMEELKAVMISVASDPETNQVSCYISVQQALVQAIKLCIYYKTVSIGGLKEN